MQYIINLTDAEYQNLVKDGVLQVISRRKNGTLQRFKKIMVETVSDSGNTSNLMQQIVKANQSALSAINEIGKNAVQISDTTKNIASNIGLITNSLETIKGLNFVNIALTGVNLCVDVAGFAILSDEIKDVENSIARLSEQVKKTLGASEAETLAKYGECVDNYVDILDKEKRHIAINDNVYFENIVKMKSVLTIMYRCFIEDAVYDKESILSAVMALSAMYAMLIRKYDTYYYFSDESKATGSEWHLGHDSWLDIFHKLQSAEFFNKLQQYCFIDLKLSARKSTETSIDTMLSAINEETIITDNQELLKFANTREEYQKLQNYADQQAEDELMQDISSLPEENKAECLRAIQDVLPHVENTSQADYRS